MPKWVQLHQDPLKFNPYQAQFWEAQQSRLCTSCKVEGGLPLKFDAITSNDCQVCGTRGLREFYRLTLLAGRRGGKTRAASIAAVKEACIPNSVVWCAAPTNPKLHRYVIPAVQQLIPPEWVQSWSSEFLDLRLKNGSLIHFQTLEDPDQGRGQGLDCVWIDEVCELTETHWNVLRPSLTERRGVALFSSSPRSYDWVWKLFYKAAEDGIPGYWACKYTTADNPIISAEEIADARATMPDTMFRQEYLADFVIFEGAVYGSALDPQILDSDEAIRTVLPEWPEIAPWRQVLAGVDTGADHPFGCVKLVSSEKGLVVVGEYLQRDKSFVEHCGSLIRLASSSNVRWGINRNERQPMIELAQHGIMCQGAENDVVSGTERVKSWLHARQLWFAASACPLTVQQMKAYRWAKNEAKDESKRTEKVFKKDDELPDCLRYALMTWPAALQAPPKVEPTLRDISYLPQKAQDEIRILRKTERDPATLKPTDITGDFWG